jgi:hypothetical protein
MENVEGSDDYTKFFDNDKFMVPSDTETLKTISNDQNHILNFVNIKQDSITIIVRQAANVNEFDLTAREWYGEGLVPEYLNDFDRVSDFMVDVFVFRGEFDAVKMSNDPIYSKYFTVDGIDKTKLNEFINLRQVSLIAQYTGSILPGFKNIEGRNLYIESIINAEARRTGLFCAVDEDMVMNDNGTAVDFVGHVCEAGNVYSSLSHNIKIDDRIRTFEFGTDDAGVYTHTTGNTNFVVKYLSADAPSVFEISNGELVQSSTVGRLARVSRVSKAVDN